MKKSKFLLSLFGTAMLAAALLMPATAVESVITAFTPDNNTYRFSEKPTLKEVQEILPDTISVYLNGSSQPTEIPVTWNCSNFSEDTAHYIFEASWDTERYPLSADYEAEGYQPFQEVVVSSAEKYSNTDSLTAGQRNFLQRAAQQLNFAWTPAAPLAGYCDSTGVTQEWYNTGTTYYGLPYGMPIDTNSYIPFNASFQTYLNAIADPNSKIYTQRGTHKGGYPKMNCVYYSNDCSSYACYCYGIGSRLTTASIARSQSFSKVSSIQNIQIGDCLNYRSHHIRLVTGITRDASGQITALTVSEQTPPRMRSGSYAVSVIQEWLNDGYSILRYKYLNNVSTPVSYSGYSENSNIYYTCDMTDIGSYGGIQTDLHNCKLSLSSASLPYTGTEVRPNILIKLGEDEDGNDINYPLVEGVDCRLTYSNNVEKGTASVTVTGINRYTGSASLNFTIRDENVTDFFGDISLDQYYAAPVYWAVKHNITNGMDIGIFAPNSTCTREQVVTFLWRAYGSPEPTSTDAVFTDSSAADYSYKAILWAAEKGITTGTSTTTFSPKQNCTRAQVVTFLYRSALALSENPPTAPSQVSNPFRDVAAEQYYYNAVLWAVEKEITNGTSQTTFSPDDDCTRAQIVTFLYRYFALESK